MPCLCGDPYCWSCGPAQGNERCPACGEWSADGGCAYPTRCAQAIERMEERIEEVGRVQALQEAEDAAVCRAESRMERGPNE